MQVLFDFYDLVVEKEWLTGLKTKKPKYPSPYCPPTTHSSETIIAGGGSDILRLIILKKTTRHDFKVISSECWENISSFYSS